MLNIYYAHGIKLCVHFKYYMLYHLSLQRDDKFMYLLYETYKLIVLWSFSVDQSKGMLGTFAPQKDPYVYALKEDTTPSGALVRGVYSAKLKVWECKRVFTIGYVLSIC